jgi:molybdenum cofactor cytidylyltransferase
MTNKTAILILAAGGSSRMGEPKQLLPWKQTTLLGNSIEQALLVKEAEVFVVLGSSYKEIRSSIQDFPITILINELWEQGMGSSISIGINKILEKNSFDNVLIMLADQPFVDGNYLTELQKRFCQNPKKIIASNYNDKFGVPVIFGKQFFPDLRALKEEVGAKKLLNQYKSIVEVYNSKFIFEDIDTKKKYKDLIHRENQKTSKKR